MTSAVDRARKLLEAATPGRWHAIRAPRSVDFTSSVWAPNDHQVCFMVEHMDEHISREHADAELIAQAPELLSQLVAEVERLADAIEATEAERNSYREGQAETHELWLHERDTVIKHERTSRELTDDRDAALSQLATMREALRHIAIQDHEEDEFDLEHTDQHELVGALRHCGETARAALSAGARERE